MIPTETNHFLPYNSPIQRPCNVPNDRPPLRKMRKEKMTISQGKSPGAKCRDDKIGVSRDGKNTPTIKPHLKKTNALREIISPGNYSGGLHTTHCQTFNLYKCDGHLTYIIYFPYIQVSFYMEIFRFPVFHFVFFIFKMQKI